MADAYGLEDLSNAERLLVEQKTEDFQSRERYKIKNERGRIVYYMMDEAASCLSGPSTMNILGLNQQEVIQLSSQRSCESVSCFPFCCGLFQKLEVRSYYGDLFGRIEQVVSWSTISYNVKDGSGNIVFKIKQAPRSCCAESSEYKILSPDKSTELGQIIKRWGNLRQEVFSNIDHFGVSFPFDLDVRKKAILMAACFMIVLSSDKSIEVGKIFRNRRYHYGISFPLDLDVRMKAVLLGACFLIDYIFYKNSD